ncbi:MAG: hypothetical protein M3O46_08890 [Myxococcota bacterium]|nr:hypothetical protein [Myxococcota bacterium]
MVVVLPPAGVVVGAWAEAPVMREAGAVEDDGIDPGEVRADAVQERRQKHGARGLLAVTLIVVVVVDMMVLRFIGT